MRFQPSFHLQGHFYSREKSWIPETSINFVIRKVSFLITSHFLYKFISSNSAPQGEQLVSALLITVTDSGGNWVIFLWEIFKSLENQVFTHRRKNTYIELIQEEYSLSIKLSLYFQCAGWEKGDNVREPEVKIFSSFFFSLNYDLELADYGQKSWWKLKKY